MGKDNRKQKKSCVPLDEQQAERLANTYADAILRLSYAYLKNTQDALENYTITAPYLRHHHRKEL